MSRQGCIHVNQQQSFQHFQGTGFATAPAGTKRPCVPTIPQQTKLEMIPSLSLTPEALSCLLINEIMIFE